jgi:hypothetical protein
MIQDIDNRIKQLCRLIAAEQDRFKFLDLVIELNQVLDLKEQRLKKCA